MASSDLLVGASVLVHPRRSLVRNGLLSVIVSGIPLWGVLYWLSLSQGSWRRVAVVNVLLLLIVLVLLLRFRAGFVRVDTETITKQAFARRVTIRRADVATIVISRIYRLGSTDTIPQLLARDETGRIIFRMRGTFWSRADMMRVSAAIGASLTVDDTPVSFSEYYDANPGVAYWYEGRRWIAIVAIVTFFVAAAAVISWLMHAIGVEVAYSLPL